MSNPSGGGGGLIALGIGGVVLYVYAGAIILGLTVLTVNSLFVYRLYKMQASEEETRHGKATRAFLGFLLIIFVQYFLYTNSTLRDGAADQQVIQDWYQKESGVFGGYYLLIGAAAFVLGFITVKSVPEQNPGAGSKYMLAFAFAVGASALTASLMCFTCIVFVPLSSGTTLAFNLALASKPVFLTMTLLHIVMSRLHTKDGEEARVYFFDRLLYTSSKHADVIVPPLFISLQLFFDLIGQKPLGFSVDYVALREELMPKTRYDFTFSPSGTQAPIRLDGGGEGGDGPRVHSGRPVSPALSGGVPTIPSSDSFPDAVRDMLIAKGRMPPPEPPPPEVVVANEPPGREVTASLAAVKRVAEPPVAPQDDLEDESPSFVHTREERADWRREHRRKQAETPIPPPRAVGRPQFRVVR